MDAPEVAVVAHPARVAPDRDEMAVLEDAVDESGGYNLFA